MPDTQYYKKQGPDGKWYQTTAASPEEAKTKLSAAISSSSGVQQQSQTKPTTSPQATQPGFGKRYAQTMQIPTNKQELESAMKGASGAGYAYQTGKGIYEGVKAGIEDTKAGHLLKGAAEFISGLAPVPAMLGTNIGEDIKNKNVRGLLGTGAGLATQAALLHVGSEINPESLRTRAAALDTKVLKTAEAGAHDKTAVGLQVANEHIVGMMKSLPAKIEAVRSAKNAKVQALAKYHDAQGHTVDAVPEIAPLMQNIQTRLNTQGLITGSARNAVMGILDQLKVERDMATGQTRSVDLSKLTVSKALGLTQGLGKIANWGSEAKVAVEPFIERIRLGINNAMDKVDPEITKTRTEEHRLIKARDTADEQYTKMVNDKTGMARGIMYSNAPTIMVWLGLRGLGLMTPVTALGTVILLKTLAESSLSRTARAALYARAADLFEHASPAVQGVKGGAGGPQSPSMGQWPSLPAKGGSGAANAVAGQPTAPRGGLPPMPNAGPEVTRQRMAALPESATRARAGSGDYVKKTQIELDTEFFKKHELKATEKTEFFKKKEAGATVATSTTTSPKNKAMLDRLDNLLDRRPKSGAENNAIKREIGEIKRVLSGEADTKESSAINKRIADRERLATKRTAAGAVQTGPQTSASGEAVAQSSSPETRAIALDAGYKALAHYEGGDMMVKALKGTAKAMQKIDQSYDEVEKLTEALQILKSMPKEEQ